jgi:hypothetical protein
MSLHVLLMAAFIASPPDSVTIPMDVEGNAPIIEVEFKTPNGKWRSARMLVDTGGGALILGSNLMNEIGAKPIGPISTEEGSRMAPVQPTGVRIGGMEVNMSDFGVVADLDSARPMPRNSVEGMVPARLLAHYDVVFDYPHRKFTLAKPGSMQHLGVKIPSPAFERTKFLRLEVGVGAEKVGFLLDTGGSFTMLSQVQMDRWNAGAAKETGAVGFANMFGGPIEANANMMRLPDLSFGGIDVKRPGAVSRPEGTFEKWMSQMMTAPIVGSIAGNVLRDFRLEIDYANGFTYWQRFGTALDADLSTVGLVLTALPDKGLEVAGVSSSAADDVKRGIRPGDILVSVDGTPFARSALAQAELALAGKPGSKKQLTIRRNGSLLLVAVTVKQIL